MGDVGTRRTGRPWADLKGDDPGLHDLAQHLRAVVDRSGHTLQAVGKRCRCSRTTVSKWLSGAELPTWEFVVSLVRACVTDPAVREKRTGQLHALWQRAAESRPRRQHPTTDVVPDPRAMVIAAQAAAIDAQQQLLDLHDRLHDAQQQLFDSQRAERRASQLVWVLYWALGRAFHLVGDLTQKRDTARLANNQSGLKPAERQLNAAQATRVRTERQLERAQSEQQRATALAEAAAQKVTTLRTMLTRIDSHDDQLPEIIDEDEVGIDLADLNGGLDRMEHLLDTQDGELTRLDQEINGPPLVHDTTEERPASLTSASKPSTKEVARLREIAMNPDISLAHRVKACDSLKGLGPDHHSDAATAFRSIIMDKSIAVSDRALALMNLGRLGRPYRQEATKILQKSLNDESCNNSNKISFLRFYNGIGDGEQRTAGKLLQRIALDDSTAPLDRIHAAGEWWKCIPDATTQVVTLLKEIKDQEGLSEVIIGAAEQKIHEITTNPW